MIHALPPSGVRNWRSRQQVLHNLADAEWAADVARRRNVTRAAVMALVMTPEIVSLCVDCLASGKVDGKPQQTCRECNGLGYSTGVGRSDEAAS
jgi:hypothetical protein